MFPHFYILMAFLFSPVPGNILEVYNRCPHTVWPGIQGMDGNPTPIFGGFELKEFERHEITVKDGWTGRIWGRTGCDETGNCATGDCKGKIQCNGSEASTPVTYAAIWFNIIDSSYSNDNYYSLTITEGYNLPMEIKPGFRQGKEASGKKCQTIGCWRDLNNNCPDELTVRNDSEYVIACKSACQEFKTDQYCCRGKYNSTDTCKSEEWPVDYPKIFKQACPGARTYANDIETQYFSCEAYTASTGSKFLITYCP